MKISLWFTAMFVLADAHAGGLSAGVVTPRERGAPYGAQGYLEYLPPGYGDGIRRPLLIDLPGRMESGRGTSQDLAWMTQVGVEGEITRRRWPAEMPFVVLTPQHGSRETCPSAGEIARFIQFAKAAYHVDPERIYLSGLSCGARGIADYLRAFGGGDLAGALILSGDLTPAWRARGCALGREVALFAVHGGRDDVIDVRGDRTAFVGEAGGPSGLLDCPGRRDADYLEYPNATHQDPYDWTYARYDKDYFARLLRSTKAQSLPGEISRPIGAAP